MKGVDILRYWEEIAIQNYHRCHYIWLKIQVVHITWELVGKLDRRSIMLPQFNPSPLCYCKERLIYLLFYVTYSLHTAWQFFFYRKDQYPVSRMVPTSCNFDRRTWYLQCVRTPTFIQLWHLVMFIISQTNCEIWTHFTLHSPHHL